MVVGEELEKKNERNNGNKSELEMFLEKKRLYLNKKNSSSK